jgi:hypothetical protein
MQEESVMMSTAARKAVFLAAASLFVGAVSVNCSKKTSDKHDDTVGAVALELTLPSGQELRTVNFEIRNAADMVVRSGSIDVSGQNSQPAVLITGLTPGHYNAVMTGTTVDMTTMCRGESGFDVLLNQTTQVNVLLQCRQAGTTGSAVVNGSFNTCPVIDAVVITPLATDVGSTINLQATSHDPDCTMLSGTMCTHFEDIFSNWTATAGTIAPANAANATYTCSAPGVHTLTLTVTDHNADGSNKCPVTFTRQVTCVSLSCGNNMREADRGEECDGTDTPAGQHCDANCRIVPTCGNSIREGGEQCDPPNMGPSGPNTCNAQCQGVPIECGNNLIQPGETCDPPAAGSCSPTCQVLVARCGDGIVNTPPGGVMEQCDLGPQNGVPGSGCTATCTNAPTCAGCEMAGQTNPNSANACNPAISGCSQLTGSAQTLCLALVSCIRTTGCAVDADGDAQPCYCGTVSDDDCFGGLANGACRTQAEAAAMTMNPITLGTRAADPNFPIGRAFNLMKCDVRAGCGPTGLNVCPL